MKRRKYHMTPAWVTSLKPGKKPREYRDALQPGLVLRVEASGRKTWVCRYTFGGRERRFSIGQFPAVKLGAARAEAERKRGSASLGTDPQAQREKVRHGETVRTCVGVWLASAEARSWRPRSRASFLSHVNIRILPMLGRLKVGEVSRANVLRMLDSLDGSASRNRCLTVTRMFFGWCQKRGLVDANSTAGIDKLPEEPRSRVLSDAEMRSVIRAFGNTRWGAYVFLLVLTAVRRDELLGARWADIDTKRGTWTIAPADEKAGRSRRGGPRVVVLSGAAIATLARQREQNMARGLASPWVFPTTTGNRPHRDAVKPTLNRLRGLRSNGLAPSSDKRAPKRKATIPLDVTLHDIRRTVADRLLNSFGIAAYIVDVGVLGHAKPALLGVYAPTAPLEDTRKALELWAGELERIRQEAGA